jgi:hypothetical protein
VIPDSAGDGRNFMRRQIKKGEQFFRFPGAHACVILFQATNVMKDTGNMGEKNHATDFRLGEDMTVLYEGNGPGIDGNLADVDDTVADAVFPFCDKREALPHKGRRSKQPP